MELRRLDPGAGLPTPTPEPGTVQLPLEPDITDPTKGHHALFLCQKFDLEEVRIIVLIIFLFSWSFKRSICGKNKQAN